MFSIASLRTYTTTIPHLLSKKKKQTEKSHFLRTRIFSTTVPINTHVCAPRKKFYYPNLHNNCTPSVWKFVDFRRGAIIANAQKGEKRQFLIFQTKKVKKKNVFSEKMFQSGHEFLQWKVTKIFLTESDSKMVKNLYTKKWLKIFCTQKWL